MEYRPLEITVVSAKGLKKVKHLSKMDVYVAVKLSGDPKQSGHREQRTHLAKEGGTSPRWNNSVVNFTVDQILAQANHLVITFKIICSRTVRGDKDIGGAHVPVKELLDHLGNDKTAPRYIKYAVKKPNGKPRGEINFMYRFGDKVTSGSGGFAAHAPPQNQPALGQLLPNVGSSSYGCSPSPPLSAASPMPAVYTNASIWPPPSTEAPPAGYPTAAPPQTQPTGYYGTCPPEGYQTAAYPAAAEGPPAGYPMAAPPQTPPAGYPVSPFRRRFY